MRATAAAAASAGCHGGLLPCRTDTALKALRIKTVEDISKYKYCVWAEALVALAEYENADFGSR